MLEDHDLRSVNRHIGLAAGKSGLPHQRGVSRGIHESSGRDSQITVTRGEEKLLDATILESHLAQHGSHHDANAGGADRGFHPAAQRDFIVVNGDRHRPAHWTRRALRAKIAENIVRNSVRELARIWSVGVKPAESADDGIDRLVAEAWQAIHEENV